ncbi:MAG: efflux RND transporter permease subunit [Candidatus Pacebacteria bacterium]|nr:efflux RND transporter permease subunit [Candidatus Paceibacterota bacterium]
MTRIFIERPIATILVMVALFLSGLLGYRLMPVSALPEVDFPTIAVTSQWRGASPETMVQGVTVPLERQLGKITGIRSMVSTSGFGTSRIVLQFELSRNIDSAAQDVQSAISAAAGLLPKALPYPPVYHKVNPADSPILVLAVTAADMSLGQLQDLSNAIIGQKIAEIDGVGLVTLAGGQRPAVRIRANPSALAAKNLTLADVRLAVAAANVNQAKGQIETRQQSFAIQADDQILELAAWRELIIARQGSVVVRLQDVATVVQGVENEQLSARSGSTPAVLINIQRQPGANIIEVVGRIKRILPQLTAAMPPSVETKILIDRTATIRASLFEVQLTLLLSVGLVVLVMFMFLKRLWLTLIPSLTLPLSLVGSMGILYLLGFSLDNLSLMALTIAAGFVVDDAIVMIENIYRFRQQGMNAREAAMAGSKQISFTIISLTVSLVAVFIPLLFMSGVIGRLFREFAITLSVAVVVSAIISLTLTPMMCAHEPKGRGGKGERKGRRESNSIDSSGRIQDWVMRHYSTALDWVMARQGLVLGLTVATFVATIVLYITAPKGFLPQQDTGVIVGVLDASSDSSFAAMEDYSAKMVAVIRADPAVESVSSVVGTSVDNPTLNSARLSIALRPHDQRRDTSDQVIRRLTEQSGAVVGTRLYLQSVQDIQLSSSLSRTAYQIVLQETVVGRLQQSTARLLERLQERPEFIDLASDQSVSGLDARLEIDRSTAAKLGVSIATISDALYDAYGQRQISTVFTATNQYPVILEVPAENRRSVSDLGLLRLRDSSGGIVPLSSVVRVTEQSRPMLITHQGVFPAATLSFNLAPGYSLSDALAGLAEARKAAQLPTTVSLELSGDAEEFRNSLSTEPWLLAAAIFVIYIVLGILYESFIHPLTIISTLPSAGVGALLALRLTGRPLDVIGIIGIILLIGIVKKNAIMMIDFAIDAERNHGMSPEQAIIQACKLRFRPIIMTTLAALAGAVPLAIGTGVGAELRQNLGIVIIGGLVVSQLLTVFSTPVVYLFFSRFFKNQQRGTVK